MVVARSIFVRSTMYVLFVYNHVHFRCSYAQSIVSQDDELSLVSSQDDELSLVSSQDDKLSLVPAEECESFFILYPSIFSTEAPQKFGIKTQFRNSELSTELLAIFIIST